MKKSLLAAAVLSAVSFGAYADGVELYGILDVAVGTASKQFNADPQSSTSVQTQAQTYATQTLTGMFNGGIQGSRWGIKGKELIDEDLSAIFTLESGINIGSGSLVNQVGSVINNTTGQANNTPSSSLQGELFNRTAWVGIESKEMGKLTFGRQYALGYDVYSKYDPVQYAGLFSPLGASGTIGGSGGATELLRQNNSVKYTLKSGVYNLGAMYKFGNQAGSNSQGSAYGFNAGYEAGNFGIQAVYQGATDVFTASACSKLNSDGSNKTNCPAGYANLTEFNTNAFIITAMYKFNNNANGKVGYQRVNLSAPSDPLSSLPSGVYDQTFSVAYILQLASNRSFNVFDIGGDIDLSDRLNLSAGYYVVNYDAYAATPSTSRVNVGNGIGAAPGLTASSSYSLAYTSALLDYKLSKRTDTYLGFMSTQPGGAYSAYQNNSIIAAGLRHKF